MTPAGAAAARRWPALAGALLRLLALVLPSRALIGRSLAVLTLVLALPACQQLVAEAVSAVLDVCADDCEDGCNDPDRCLGNCAHCACCKSPSAISVLPVVALPWVASQREPALTAREAVDAPGYGSPPFRPPTA